VGAFEALGHLNDVDFWDEMPQNRCFFIAAVALAAAQSSGKSQANLKKGPSL
jgi:hypothetical protein